MRYLPALFIAPLALLYATASVALTRPAYYCDPLHVYYPAVATCPVPWRAIWPSQAIPQPNAPLPSGRPPNPAYRPTAHPTFQVLGDGLDDWCATVRLPSSIAICSDRELRTLAIERQHAFDEARSRLSPNQQKALLADQNGWVKTYPQACGLSRDIAPALPLTPTIKNCMAEAGQARIAYLKVYGMPSGDAAVVKPTKPTAPAEPATTATAEPEPAPATAPIPAALSPAGSKAASPTAGVQTADQNPPSLDTPDHAAATDRTGETVEHTDPDTGQPEGETSTFKCRDPKTNFVYERPKPCAIGDITLEAPKAPPHTGVAAPQAATQWYSLDMGYVHCIKLDPNDSPANMVKIDRMDGLEDMITVLKTDADGKPLTVIVGEPTSGDMVTQVLYFRTIPACQEYQKTLQLKLQDLQ
jgi:uncharacterized protein YecT (DUF1311 family)